MKANAPEKIYVYIPDDDIVGTASLQKGFPHQFVTEEYTRTDAFIEKACEFMRNHIDPQLTIYHEQTWCKRDEFIKKFCKYMRGE